VHAVPVGAGESCGASGDPAQLGTMQADDETGKLLESSMELIPPAPSQTTCWQSPMVWRGAGATLLPG
jgi:hypothetical protein